MKRVLLLMLVAISLTSNVYAQRLGRNIQDRNHFDEELNERDFDALRDFLKTKREEDLKQKAANIIISGDVRFEWRHMTEFFNHENLRGDGATKRGVPISRNDFDVEANLRFDYKTNCDWAVLHLNYDNSAGIDPNDVDCFLDPNGFRGSGQCDDLCLKKAYYGYRLYQCGCHDFFIEIGRRGNLYSVFDSRIQFLSRFDGIFLRYKGCTEALNEWYWSFAAFVIDERIDHFGFCTEIGLLNIHESGLDLKYSLIDWVKRGNGRCRDFVFKNKEHTKVRLKGRRPELEEDKYVRNPRGFEFLNSQVTLAYHFTLPCLCDWPGTLYGAFEINHLGQRAKYFKGPFIKDIDKGKDEEVIEQLKTARLKTAKNQNKAWYAGVIFGEVEKAGDFSFEVRYEWVQAFAVPDEDCSGICNGNVLNLSLLQWPNAGGNTNYKGWRFESLYALTDNITIDTQLEWSTQIDKSIGGPHSYSKIEVETIYAF